MWRIPAAIAELTASEATVVQALNVPRPTLGSLNPLARTRVSSCNADIEAAHAEPEAISQSVAASH